MRFRRHNPPPEDTGIDLAPMLDFFLNLLIFFIISTAFVSEAGIKVNRPTAKTAVKDAKDNILIAVSAQGEVWIDKKRVDIRALRAMVAKLHAQHPEAAVIIQADKDARAGLMVEAMDQARQAGVANVSIAATPQR
jgi:biopolymer transport protein ExbD